MKMILRKLKNHWDNSSILFHIKRMTPPVFGGVFFILCVFLTLIIKHIKNEDKPKLEGTHLVLDIAESKAEDLSLIYYLNGLTKASTSVLIKSEIAGRVESIFVKSGTYIEKGTPILKINDLDIQAHIAAAKSRVKEKEMEFRASEKLSLKGVKTAIEAERSRAEFEEAKASLAKLEEAVVKAPDDGFIDYIGVDAGEYLSAQSVIGKFLKLNPIKVLCYVSEKSRPFMEEGFKAEVFFPFLKKTFTGKVTFLSRTAELRTKVYFLEIEIENKDHDILEGMHCDVSVFSPSKKRHSIPLSVLTLDDDGIPGVKFINDQHMVDFVPVSIEQVQKGSIVFEHASPSLRYVRYGADFVVKGQKINPESGKILQ
jgi:multidrug efflux system membrane fusion protein